MDGGATPLARRLTLPGERALLAIGAVLALIGAALFPPAAFSVDEAIYADMAHAMASRGAFDVTPQDLPAGAPMMAKSDHLVQIIGDKAIPQYPALYGVIAAPFFLVAGVKGLIFLNALSALFVLWATHKIARRLTHDDWIAGISVVILGAASIFAGYIFAIWPHMLALAFVTGGALAAVRAGESDGRNAALWAGIAGLIFGVGVGVRIDVILAAAAAFFWFRLFAQPKKRSVALALVAGLAPGLIAVAAINQAKFGVFNPFTYGADVGSISIGHHLKLIVPVALAGVLSFAFDASSTPARSLLNTARQAPLIAYAGAAAALVAGLWIAVPGLFSGAWLMLIDIQSYAGAPRPGLEKDAYGYWDFWGVPKKALLQSMPWITLAAAPMIGFLRGVRVRETAFLLLFACAVILFFAMRGWHGGMAYNMRYYLSATPFTAILAAVGLNTLRPVFDAHRNLFLRSAVAGVVLAIAAYAVSPLYGAYATPLRLYPQLAIAAALAIVLLIVSLRADATRVKDVAAGLAAVALTNAALISVFDANGYYADRARYVPYDRAYAAIVPQDAVIFTQFDELLISASLNGAMVVRVTDDHLEEIAAVIGAYEHAGRCIYAHTAPAARTLSPERFEALPMPANAPAPGLALFVYRDSPARCRGAS